MATIKIDWMKRWANSPRIIVEDIKVPNYPIENYPIWEKSPDGLHLARKGDFAFYFFSDGKPTEGYGGRRFAGTFKDGTKFEYVGAWSSRAGCINAAIARGELTGDHIVDVVVGYCATAVNLPFIDRHWDFPYEFMRKGDRNEFTYEPAYKGLFKGDVGFTYPE
jgi:hypothetical protein